MTFEIYKLEWILSRHTFGNTTKLLKHGAFDCGLYITSNGCEKKWTRELRVFKA